MNAERMIHDLVQGSDEWHQFRFEHDGASEAAAALGMSKKTTRTELLRMKHTGIAREFSDWVQENVLDRGHEVEAAARPFVEQMIGQDLYPATYSYGRLSASCDGLTMDGETAFEHKQYNKELFAAVKRAELPDEHKPQCQQVMHVTGAARLIFVCSDGTLENMTSMEVQPDPAWVKRIDAGWAQFHEDLENYQHVEAAPVAVAALIKDLPAIVVTVAGALTVESNFTVWGAELNAFIARIPAKPKTDQEFADCKAAVAALKKAEAQLDAEESRVLSMVPDIDQMKRDKKLLRDLSSTTRLALEKLVVERDTAVKVEIIQAGKDALTDHIAGLNKRLAKVQMPMIVADFAAAIKGKKLYSVMRGAVADLVAAKKIESNEIADRITINLQALHDGTRLPNADYSFLFSDYTQLILKAPDDLALVIKSRIQDHAAAEEKRLEAERQKIRVEEEARAAAEAKIRADQIAREQAQANEMAMQEIMGINQQVVIAQAGRLGVRVGGTIECIRETLAETETWMIDDRFGALAGSAQAAKDRAIASIRELLAKAERDRNTQEPAAVTANDGTGETPASGTAKPCTEPAPQPAVQTITQAIPPSSAATASIDDGARIRLGEISDRLGFTVTADFIASLGFQPVETIKAAKLYRESHFKPIVAALIDRLEAVRQRDWRAAA